MTWDVDGYAPKPATRRTNRDMWYSRKVSGPRVVPTIRRRFLALCKLYRLHMRGR